MNNYTVYHLHSDMSLLDSCTKYQDYIARAVELGQTAICFTEHGNIFNWVSKKIDCEKAGLKYLHGCEVYLTQQLEPKVRDNYHTILIAKNFDGMLELNSLISKSNESSHFYFKPRISFDEFFNISDNIIKISACLASPLSKLEDVNLIQKLIQKYDYLEVQPHIRSEEQKEYNKKLYEYSKRFNKPLIAGTDTHSLNQYKAECRAMLQLAKRIPYALEDTFDLTYKSYDELVDMFEKQDCLSKNVYMEAIENTNRMADSVEVFELDTSFKYPKVYDDDIKELKERINLRLTTMIDEGVIPENQRKQFITNLREEVRVFEKINMCGFMLFMSDLIEWCHNNNIPTGVARGSCGGSCVAYVLGIIDINPVQWKTVFSRFANEDRKEIGDIDIDFAPNDREKVYNHMIEKFGAEYTDYILALGTISDKGCIDEIGRALSFQHPDNSLYSLESLKQVKKEFESNPDKARKKYPDIFYYFDGMINTIISQSMHPCGMVVSPIPLNSNYGELWNDGKKIIQIDMDAIHDVSLVKYDVLGLKNIGIIKDACASAGIKYPKSHMINWDDKKVWDDMIRCPQGIFQFESAFAFQNLLAFKPQSIYDMSLVTAALRPSGASYRDDLMQRKIHHNISPMIDDLLKDNYGYLIYQCDVIKFLQQICGLSGSEADNVRRAIARKQMDRLEAALPKIQDGYVEKSGKPREEALQELQEYIRILIDASSYMFGYNHSVAYCLIGYLCAYLRYYYPADFILSYLNNADNEDDVVAGYELSKIYNVDILPPRFRHSTDVYVLDKKENKIYKGVSSVKFINSQCSLYLYSLKDNKYDYFVDLLQEISEAKTEDNKAYINSRQMEILIKLQYFEEFGKNLKLYNIYQKFLKLYGRKTIPKDTIGEYNIPEDVLQSELFTQTEKQYKLSDSMAVLRIIEEREEDKNFDIKDQIDFESEVLGYIGMTYDVDKRICYVLNVETKFSPKITLYCLQNGKNVICKINKSMYSANPIKKGEIIQAINFEQRFKQIKTEAGWQKTDEKEWWLSQYKILTEFK